MAGFLFPPVRQPLSSWPENTVWNLQGTTPLWNLELVSFGFSHSLFFSRASLGRDVPGYLRSSLLFRCLLGWGDSNPPVFLLPKTDLVPLYFSEIGVGSSSAQNFSNSGTWLVDSLPNLGLPLRKAA